MSGPGGSPDAPPGGAPGPDPRKLRITEHSASHMLRGEELRGPAPPVQYDEALERHVRERVLTTTLERAVAWAQVSQAGASLDGASLDGAW